MMESLNFLESHKTFECKSNAEKFYFRSYCNFDMCLRQVLSQTLPGISLVKKKALKSGIDATIPSAVCNRVRVTACLNATDAQVASRTIMCKRNVLAKRFEWHQMRPLLAIQGAK